MRSARLCFQLASETFGSADMSGAFAALRGFRRRWADPEPGPESALAPATEPENTFLSVTPDSASRSNGSFPASSASAWQWAPQRVDGIVPVAVEPCFRPVFQYRPLRGPVFVSRCSPMARVEQPLPPPVYRGAAFYDRGPRFRINLQTAQAPASSSPCSARLASTLSPCVPASMPPQLLQGAPVVSSDKIGGLRGAASTGFLCFGAQSRASAHSANWKKVLGFWSELVSRHAVCSPHFAGALGSEHKEVLLSQMLSRMADTTLLRYLRSVMLFFDMLDTMRLQLSDLYQAHVMDVLLCLQEASGGPLVAQINQVKALRWYVRASGIPFPDLYGGLFLSVMQPPDGVRWWLL